jgi:hypothetical protein
MREMKEFGGPVDYGEAHGKQGKNGPGDDSIENELQKSHL